MIRVPRWLSVPAHLRAFLNRRTVHRRLFQRTQLKSPRSNFTRSLVSASRGKPPKHNTRRRKRRRRGRSQTESRAFDSSSSNSNHHGHTRQENTGSPDGNRDASEHKSATSPPQKDDTTSKKPQSEKTETSQSSHDQHSHNDQKDPVREVTGTPKTLRQAMRAFFRRIHPDYFERRPMEQAINTTGFGHLTSLMGALRQGRDAQLHATTINFRFFLRPDSSDASESEEGGLSFIQVPFKVDNPSLVDPDTTAGVHECLHTLLKEAGLPYDFPIDESLPEPPKAPDYLHSVYNVSVTSKASGLQPVKTVVAEASDEFAKQVSNLRPVYLYAKQEYIDRRNKVLSVLAPFREHGYRILAGQPITHNVSASTYASVENSSETSPDRTVHVKATSTDIVPINALLASDNQHVDSKRYVKWGDIQYIHRQISGLQQWMRVVNDLEWEFDGTNRPGDNNGGRERYLRVPEDFHGFHSAVPLSSIYDQQTTTSFDSSPLEVVPFPLPLHLESEHNRKNTASTMPSGVPLSDTRNIVRSLPVIQTTDGVNAVGVDVSEGDTPMARMRIVLHEYMRRFEATKKAQQDLDARDVMQTSDEWRRGSVDGDGEEIPLEPMPLGKTKEGRGLWSPYFSMSFHKSWQKLVEMTTGNKSIEIDPLTGERKRISNYEQDLSGDYGYHPVYDAYDSKISTHFNHQGYWDHRHRWEQTHIDFWKRLGPLGQYVIDKNHWGKPHKEGGYQADEPYQFTVRASDPWYTRMYNSIMQKYHDICDRWEVPVDLRIGWSENPDWEADIRKSRELYKDEYLYGHEREDPNPSPWVGEGEHKRRAFYWEVASVEVEQQQAREPRITRSPLKNVVTLLVPVDGYNNTCEAAVGGFVGAVDGQGRLLLNMSCTDDQWAEYLCDNNVLHQVNDRIARYNAINKHMGTLAQYLGLFHMFVSKECINAVTPEILACTADSHNLTPAQVEQTCADSIDLDCFLHDMTSPDCTVVVREITEQLTEVLKPEFDADNVVNLSQMVVRVCKFAEFPQDRVALLQSTADNEAKETLSHHLSTSSDGACGMINFAPKGHNSSVGTDHMHCGGWDVDKESGILSLYIPQNYASLRNISMDDATLPSPATLLMYMSFEHGCMSCLEATTRVRNTTRDRTQQISSVKTAFGMRDLMVDRKVSNQEWKETGDRLYAIAARAGASAGERNNAVVVADAFDAAHVLVSDRYGVDETTGYIVIPSTL